MSLAPVFILLGSLQLEREGTRVPRWKNRLNISIILSSRYMQVEERSDGNAFSESKPSGYILICIWIWMLRWKESLHDCMGVWCMAWGGELCSCWARDTSQKYCCSHWDPSSVLYILLNCFLGEQMKKKVFTFQLLHHSLSSLSLIDDTGVCKFSRTAWR